LLTDKTEIEQHHPLHEESSTIVTETDTVENVDVKVEGDHISVSHEVPQNTTHEPESETDDATHSSESVASADVLDSHEDHKVDDLLASQPEKAPVAAPVSDTVAADTGAHHDSEPAPVADTSLLDSNLVDTPEDQ